MRISSRRMLALTLVVATVACSSSKQRVEVPPRMDLRAQGAIGMIDFSSRDSDLSRQASREFLAAIQSAQPGVAVLELGDAGGTMVASPSPDLATIRRLGEEHGVDVIIFGSLETKELSPKVSISSVLESANARAEVEASLNVKIFDTRNGATIWTKNAGCKETIASLSLTGSGVSVSGSDDPDGAEEKLVRILVAETTEDFRPTYTWVRAQ